MEEGAVYMSTAPIPHGRGFGQGFKPDDFGPLDRRARLPLETPGSECLRRQGLVPRPAASPAAAVIVNPHSANRTTGKVWPALCRLLAEAGFDFRWDYTTGPLAAISMTRQALRAGYQTIVSVGGDGTLNEVVNGFFGENGSPINPDASLGVISRGTGCDFIRAAGIPKNELAAAARLFAVPARLVDVGRVRFRGHDGQENERFFLNIADVGLGGETVDRVNHTTKAFGGFVSFLVGTVASLALYSNKDVEIAIDGGEPLRARVCIVAVANGRYFGGGMQIAPRAVLDSGHFDVVIVGDLGKLELLWNLPRVYKGAHLTHPKVTCLTGRHVIIRSREKVFLDTDGEHPGFLDAEFSILPRVLKLHF